MTCTPPFWLPISIQQILFPRVPPVRAVLGRCRRAPASSTRASQRTRERGASAAPKHGYSSCRSASAQKSERSHTRAAFSLQEREGGSVEAPLPETPCFSRGSLQGKQCLKEARFRTRRRISRRQSRPSRKMLLSRRSTRVIRSVVAHDGDRLLRDARDARATRATTRLETLPAASDPACVRSTIQLAQDVPATACATRSGASTPIHMQLEDIMTYDLIALAGHIVSVDSNSSVNQTLPLPSINRPS